MSQLFLRTFSQGLQAFMPIAVALAWCHASGAGSVSLAIKRGLILSIPVSYLAAWQFRLSTHQALDETLLAGIALVIAFFFHQLVSRFDARGPEPPLDDTRIDVTVRLKPDTTYIVAGCACLIVVRQTMEIVAILQTAAVELRSFDATSAIVTGASISGAIAWLWSRLSLRLAAPVMLSATRTFLWVFFAQGLMYAFHESAEARLLPWSEVLHAASEPYGPDGLYGVHFSTLLVIAPLVIAVRAWVPSRVRVDLTDRWLAVRQRAAMAIVTLSSCILMGMQQSDTRPPQAVSHALAEDIARMAARPHILFRSTVSGPNFGRLAMASLDAPNGERQIAAVTCERLSFASGRGLCLHLQRGVFNTYTAVLLDGNLTPGASIKLQGLPSRTRTAADGQVAAVTVFVTGDSYAAEFSTRTTIIDLSSGDQIGELEEFSTWRDGTRFRAVDFNFWGVTFARDGNTFYAALRTSGSTFLVRGELALRRLTALRENVECPSLSPDSRLLAYKKRVGPSPDSWRLHVLDLQTNVERMVAGEARYIDDQVEWLDARHVLYGVRRRTTAISDVWVAAIDGSEPARIFLPEAESPIVVR